MSADDRKRRRPLREDERALWQTFTQKIAPLAKKPARADVPEAEAVRPPPPPEKMRRVKAPAVAPQSPARVAPKQPPLAPLGRREKRSVARGEVERRLDLHGFTQAQAHVELLHFLRASAAREARLVLVITGKSGVLRQQVPHWLGLPDVRALVIGFESAAKQHGGDGALYVRIRRSRND